MLEGPDAGESPLSELRHTKFTIAGVPGEKQAILIPDTVTLDRQLLEEICDVIRPAEPAPQQREFPVPPRGADHSAAAGLPGVRGPPGRGAAQPGSRGRGRDVAAGSAQQGAGERGYAGDAGVLGRRSARQVPREEAQRREKSLEDFANRVLERRRPPTR
ncbi:unnamed protein product [Prorocentrum cordatum]|uniref:RNA helicase n=1 Tax=Prorocentrum cordatum TaxID=2364126 RepID=A0ABN9VXZ0_9DINO|nr:unnamed protein product [Polarella glacialis]